MGATPERKLYSNPNFRVDDEQTLYDAVDKIGFGTLVTTSSTGMLASHIPMLVDPKKSGKALLIGHIARGNRQWKDTTKGSDALAIFIDPHAYISPSWYETGKKGGEAVPTWNYVTVHVRGKIVFFDDSERLRALVTRLTRKYEAGNPREWKVSDPPSDYFERELKGIIGFEMPIDSIEGKWKLGQNRSEADVSGAVQGLRERGGPLDRDVAEEMEKKLSARKKSN